MYPHFSWNIRIFCRVHHECGLLTVAAPICKISSRYSPLLYNISHPSITNDVSHTELKLRWVSSSDQMNHSPVTEEIEGKTKHKQGGGNVGDESIGAILAPSPSFDRVSKFIRITWSTGWEAMRTMCFVDKCRILNVVGMAINSFAFNLTSCWP